MQTKHHHTPFIFVEKLTVFCYLHGYHLMEKFFGDLKKHFQLAFISFSRFSYAKIAIK